MTCISPLRHLRVHGRCIHCERPVMDLRQQDELSTTLERTLRDQCRLLTMPLRDRDACDRVLEALRSTLGALGPFAWPDDVRDLATYISRSAAVLEETRRRWDAATPAGREQGGRMAFHYLRTAHARTLGWLDRLELEREREAAPHVGRPAGGIPAPGVDGRETG